MGIFSVVHGVGGYVPETVVTNDQLSQTLDTSHEWILRRTGVCQRHVAAPEEYTSDLCTFAARDALKNAGMAAEEIELLLVATSTPDHAFPPTAARVQKNIGAGNAVVFDLNAACSGFLFALATADQYVKTGFFKNALVIGGETMSRVVDWGDRRTAVLFGDGAGAVILRSTAASSEEATNQRGILETVLFSDGTGYDALYVSGGPSTSPQRGVVVMDGAEVFCQAVRHLEASARTLLSRTGQQVENIQWFVSHQANHRILLAVGERLGIPQERLIFTGKTHANTSAASIPLALWDSVNRGIIQPGELVFLQAFGAGFTGGSCLLRW